MHIYQYIDTEKANRESNIFIIKLQTVTQVVRVPCCHTFDL